MSTRLLDRGKFIECMNETEFKIADLSAIIKEVKLTDDDIPIIHDELVKACLKDNIGAVRKLFETFPTSLDINFSDGKFIRAVTYRKLNDTELLKYLLEVGADPSAFNNAPIKNSALVGDIEAMKILLKDTRVNPVLTLRIAAELGHIDIVKLLLADGRQNDHNDAIKAAVRRKQLPIFQLLLPTSTTDKQELLRASASVALDKNSVIINEILIKEINKSPVTNAADEAYTNYFWGACLGGQLETVKMLIGTNPPGMDINYGFVAACQKGVTSIVEFLRNNQKIEPGFRDHVAIRIACELGRTEVVKLLINNVIQTNPVFNPSVSNNIAIRIASHKGHVELVKLLLNDPRVDPSTEDNRAIRAAGKKGHFDTVNVLLDDQRVDPSALNNSLLKSIIVRGGDLDLVKRILDDPRVNPSTEESISLNIAVEEGRTDILEILLKDKRIDPTNREYMALKIAYDRGYKTLVEMLLADDRVNPSFGKNHLLKKAFEKKDFKMVSDLLNINVVTGYMVKVDPGRDELFQVGVGLPKPIHQLLQLHAEQTAVLASASFYNKTGLDLGQVGNIMKFIKISEKPVVVRSKAIQFTKAEKEKLTLIQ